jgi:hypothetical protein
MHKLLPVILLSLLLLLPAGRSAADDMQTALLLIPPGETLARAYTPNLNDGEAAAGREAAERTVERNGREKARVLAEEDDDSYDFNVTFGKSWLFKAFRYRPIPTVTDPEKLSGFKAKADQNRCGTIETRWPLINDGIETAANFFAGSPLLLRPDYFVHLSELYGEPLPQN